MLRKAVVVLIGIELLAAITQALPVPQWRMGRLPVAPLSLEPGHRFVPPASRVWIDTDAGCGAGARTDPDDCFAILFLTSDPGVNVVGISTVFGNAALEVTDSVTRKLVAQISDAREAPPVYTGAAGPLTESRFDRQPAHQALQTALAREPLTIVALGPLTNVAAALRDRPALQRRVSRVIAVMGRRPGHLFHPAEGAGGAMLLGHGPIFRDLNFASDPSAAADLVRMQVPLVLVPYDAARRIQLTRADLDRMQARGGPAAWIAERSRGWLDFWREDIGREGFYPFDLIGSVAARRPDLLRCAKVEIRLGEDTSFRWPFWELPALLAGPEPTPAPSPGTVLATGSALYCPDVDDDLQSWLSSRLAGA